MHYTFIMDSHYINHSKFYQAIDCVIFGFDLERLKLLLIHRDFEPQKGKYSLMGGFLNENEDMDSGAARILDKLTGLEDVYLEQLKTYSMVNRDPAARVISTAYYALIKIEESDEEKTKDHGAEWFDINEIPELIFDHNSMVEQAFDIIRHKSRFHPIGFELLPEKFTIPQMQKLYEAINQVKLDNANFRKKIISMDLLQKLNEKEKEGSKKGAFLYQFDKGKYDMLVNSGFLFEVK